jgi:predicted HNH restriction endonuclease
MKCYFVAVSFDAINDIGTDTPERVIVSGVAFARDPKIRDAVKLRANGKCEFCGMLGFKGLDGKPYVECHHIIALANDGADRMTNVIALCPNHHREAHSGERRAEIEQQMIQKVLLLEGKAVAQQPLPVA